MTSTAVADSPAGTVASADNPTITMAPDERLAAAFGDHGERWARQQGAPDAAAQIARRAATLVSLATSNGHSCLAIDELLDSLNAAAGIPIDVAALRARLRESKVVGTPHAPESLPLIADDERVYLHRYFDYECRLAGSLMARSAEPSGATAPTTLPPHVMALLDQLFAGNSPEPGTPDWQKIAVISALLGRLTIISGGPGTGKTTTVVNLLACLLEANPDCRIALTAPTGKAAARMTEVILRRAGHLPEALRAKLPTASSTIHRLLGGTPQGEFRHDATHPLPIDVLIVDEASMLDLALAVHLIEAVPLTAKIILLGDKDQLAAVESGAVFSELSAQYTLSPGRLHALTHLGEVAPPPREPQLDLPFPTDRRGSLEDSVIWLRRNYRFAAGSAIGLLAADTNDGDATRALGRLGSASDPSLVWINDGDSTPSPRSLDAILKGYAPYLDAVRRHAADPAAITAAFARFRVLCAVRDGPWGVNAINQQVGTHARRTLQHPLDPGMRSEWYPGRPVMVLRNDHVLKLFNGDIGIVLPDRHGNLQVWFPVEPAGFRAIAPVRLPDHETAFAMTVHKSQGSEFDAVLLVLPAERNRVLTRELLYTAVTRARESLTLVANAGIVASAIDTPTKRVSGLLARVRNRETP